MSGGATPDWLMESLADALGVPVTAMHMAVVEDGGALLEEQPSAWRAEGWWGS